MNEEPDPQLEARLAALEPPYRSRGEAQIGRLLDRYGLPFLYEQPTLILDRGRYRVWRPDFKLPRYNGLIIEYAGMPEIPDYAMGIRRKRRVYRNNGIRALFIYPRHLKGPSWPEKLYRRIRYAGQRSVRYQLRLAGYRRQPVGYARPSFY